MVFIQSVSARTLARFCARGIPDYERRFDVIYSRWFERYGDWFAKGEAAFKEELKAENQLPLAKERLEQIESAVAALAVESVDTGAIILDERLQAACEQNLADLEDAL